VALAGTSKRNWLEQNAKAVDVKPSAETLKTLDETFKPGITQGTRYPAAMMARLGL
jgi:aryl-alcohol dehydrogenase-like predicted oxidoreductase